eukprot:gene2421-2989_t
MVKLLLEYCFDVILKSLEEFQDSDLSQVLPVDLKERLFSYYTSSISNEPSSSPFPITSYPEDRYRDVQLVNRITCQRVIPLCFAMWSSLDYQYEKVRKLIEEDACDVNESDLEGFCPLHYAAIYGRIDACKLLLMRGADCSRKNNFGKTPSDLAQDVRVQQMIKLRALLFRKEEVKEMEQDLQLKRKQIAEYQRKQLREEFMRQSKHINDILEKKGYDQSKKKIILQNPSTSSSSSSSSLQQQQQLPQPQIVNTNHTNTNNNNNILNFFPSNNHFNNNNSSSINHDEENHENNNNEQDHDNVNDDNDDVNNNNNNNNETTDLYKQPSLLSSSTLTNNSTTTTTTTATSSTTPFKSISLTSEEEINNTEQQQQQQQSSSSCSSANTITITTSSSSSSNISLEDVLVPTYSISNIPIPRTRQSNSTIVPHSIIVPSLNSPSSSLDTTNSTNTIITSSVGSGSTNGILVTSSPKKQLAKKDKKNQHPLVENNTSNKKKKRDDITDSNGTTKKKNNNLSSSTSSSSSSSSSISIVIDEKGTSITLKRIDDSFICTDCIKEFNFTSKSKDFSGGSSNSKTTSSKRTRYECSMCHTSEYRKEKDLNNNNNEDDDDLKNSSSLMTIGDGIKGLANLGNTCFFNSIMQNLTHVNLLRDVLLNEPSSDKSVVNSIGPLTRELHYFLVKMYKNNSAAHISPAGLFSEISKKSPRFRGFKQQDSHELLRCLLDGLISEEQTAFTQNNKQKGQPTYIDKIFGGQLISVITCLHCGYVSKTFEPFLDLSLSIPTPEVKVKPALPKRLNHITSSSPSGPPPPPPPPPPVYIPTISDDDEIDDLYEPLTNGPTTVSTSPPKSNGKRISKHQKKKLAKEKRLQEERESQAVASAAAALNDANLSTTTTNKIDDNDVNENKDGADQNAQPIDGTSEQIQDDEVQLVKIDQSLQPQQQQQPSQPCVDDDQPEVEEIKVISDEQPTTTTTNQLSTSTSSSLDEPIIIPITGDNSGPNNSNDQEINIPVNVQDPNSLIILPQNEEDTVVIESISAKIEINSSQDYINSVEVNKNKEEEDGADQPSTTTSTTNNESTTQLLDNIDQISKCSIIEDYENADSSLAFKSNRVVSDLAGSGSCNHLSDLEKSFENIRISNDGATSSEKKEDDQDSESDHEVPKKLLELKDLRTNIPKEAYQINNILSSFLQFTNPEKLEGENGFICSNCQKQRKEQCGNNKKKLKELEEDPVKSTASKQYLISSTPPYLTVHLKRFMQTRSGLQKNSKYIEFPQTLDLSPFTINHQTIIDGIKQDKEDIENEKVEKEDKEDKEKTNIEKEVITTTGEKYILNGIVEHMGGMGGGHYVSYIRDDTKDEWYYVSDSNVRKSSLSSVLSNEAYVLFYKKKGLNYDKLMESMVSKDIEEEKDKKIEEKDKVEEKLDTPTETVQDKKEDEKVIHVETTKDELIVIDDDVSEGDEKREEEKDYFFTSTNGNAEELTQEIK